MLLNLKVSAIVTQWCTSSSKSLPSNGSKALSNSTTSCRPSVQTWIFEETLHSNHHSNCSSFKKAIVKFKLTNHWLYSNSFLEHLLFCGRVGFLSIAQRIVAYPDFHRELAMAKEMQPLTSPYFVLLLSSETTPKNIQNIQFFLACFL